jgi:hypothetical protein
MKRRGSLNIGTGQSTWIQVENQLYNFQRGDKTANAKKVQRRLSIIGA